MNWDNFQEFKFNGVKVTAILNTKRHVWQIWFNWDGKRGVPWDLEFSKARGETAVEVLKEIVKHANDKKVSSV